MNVLQIIVKKGMKGHVPFVPSNKMDKIFWNLSTLIIFCNINLKNLQVK